MQCQLCNKTATVHLTEIIDGDQIERHLCELCAQKEGITIKAQVPLTDLLNTLAGDEHDVRETSQVTCSHCRMSWLDFRKTGQLGCPHDYEAFGDSLASLIHKAQNGAKRHVGKTPRHTKEPNKPVQDNQVRILQLQQELKKAVENEDYETAAHLRDQIKHSQ